MMQPMRENHVPLLLKDPVTLLLHLVLILPEHMDKALFTTLVRQLYNLCWIQACLKVSNPLQVDTLLSGLAALVTSLDASGILIHPQGLAHDVSSDALEDLVQANCLPYLRIAALLRHHVYNEELPQDIWEQDREFTRLSQFLEMAAMDGDGRLEGVTSASCLGWLSPPAQLVAHWTSGCQQLAARSPLAARRLILVNNIWRQPQLVTLPRKFDDIFKVLVFSTNSFYFEHFIYLF